MKCALGKHRIYTGKVEEICAEWEDSYFDACLCDPPYLLQFMGKEFDCQHKKEKGQNEGQKMQAWHEKWAREVLRVLKPGAHMLAFGGTRTYHRLVVAAEDAGFEVRDMLTWLHGQGFPKNKDTQLKPAVEPCVLVKKPGSVGKLNIDGCRLEAFDKQYARNCSGDRGFDGTRIRGVNTGFTHGGGKAASGRWPANLILDEESAAMLDEQTIGKIHSAGTARTGAKTPKPVQRGSTIDFLQGSERSTGDMHRFGDAGGASRFFYCAKVSPRERNLGNSDCTHPTLKPIALTTYLSRLLLPPRPHTDSSPRRILVPFSGAGSEIIGALLAGWDGVVGVEMDAEYVSWSRSRIKAVRNGEFETTRRKTS